MPLLLVLFVILALLFLLSRCDDGAGNPTATTPSTATDGTGSASGAARATDQAGRPDTGQSGRPGAVTAGNENLLGADVGVSLRGHAGQQAVGRGVRVQSVPADEGFWVGAGDRDRLWVQLTGTRGESDYRVREGDLVDFTGTVTSASDGFAAAVGLTGPEGADQLAEQAHYVAVPVSGVTLSR